MGISELTLHIAPAIGGTNENLNTALPRPGCPHSILSPPLKSSIRYSTRAFGFLLTLKQWKATSHIHRSSVITHTGGCESVDPSRCQWAAEVGHPYSFPKHVSAEAVLQGRYSAAILWQSPDLNSTSESLTPILL